MLKKLMRPSGEPDNATPLIGRIDIALRNARRAKDDSNAGRFESLPKAITALGIAIGDQVRLARGKAVHGARTTRKADLKVQAQGEDHSACDLDGRM